MNEIKRPEIEMNLSGNFEKDGAEITKEEALKIWNEGNSNWSWGAYAKMSQIVLGR